MPSPAATPSRLFGADHTQQLLQPGQRAEEEERDNVHNAPGSVAPLLRARYRRRLPCRLDELTGPERGRVELPLHIAWSGLWALDLDLS